jgi:hypothetical protein
LVISMFGEELLHLVKPQVASCTLSSYKPSLLKHIEFCIILPLSLFIMGCFTQSEIIKEELPQDDSEVLFHLHDGSYIKSLSGNHHRLDNGYQIKGEIVRDGITQKDYDAVVNDNEIERIEVERFDVAGTIVLVGVAVIFVWRTLMWVFISSSMH